MALQYLFVSETKIILAWCNVFTRLSLKHCSVILTFLVSKTWRLMKLKLIQINYITYIYISVSRDSCHGQKLYLQKVSKRFNWKDVEAWLHTCWQSTQFPVVHDRLFSLSYHIDTCSLGLVLPWFYRISSLVVPSGQSHSRNCVNV